MVIDRQTALDAIARGDASFSGHTKPDNDNGYWIVNNHRQCRVDHVAIADDDPLVGCGCCGAVVDPAPDQRGCGRHCPACGATL